MSITRFQNFMAASRKPNMHAFRLMPQSDNLSWIEAYAPAPAYGTVNGTINGINDTFTLADYGGEIALFTNGILQIPTTDYSYTPGTGTIVFTAGSIPAPGALLTVLAWGTYDTTSAYGTPPRLEIPSGTMNGVNATFTVAHSPSTFLLYYNGQLLKEGTGYTRNGTIITMQSGYIPVSGDQLFAVYWG